MANLGLNVNLKQKILELTREFVRNQQSEFKLGSTMIPFAGRVIDEDEYVNMVDASLDGWLTTGRFAEQFEFEFASMYGVKSCSLVNSGSSANLLALSALTSKKLGERRIKPGDEVITVAAGFPTTVNPIIQNNAIPVFIDIAIPSYNIDVSRIEEAITPRTKAIMIAHTLGNPFNLTEILKITKKYNLWLIEDCCDAVGSEYQGKLVGTFGDIATMSFYPAHHITMGEGGALITNNLQLEQLIRSFRDWGRDCYCEPGYNNTCARRFKQQFGTLPYGYDHKYIYTHIGYNLKLTDMQAAVGLAQLKKLPEFIKKRRINFRKLYNGLKKFERFLILPEATTNSNPSWFGFVITVRNPDIFSRFDLISYLEKNKIMTRMIFAGNLTRQPAYENVNFRIVGTLTNTDKVMNDTFFIGVYPGITDEMVKYIIQIFEKFFLEQEL